MSDGSEPPAPDAPLPHAPELAPPAHMPKPPAPRWLRWVPIVGACVLLADFAVLGWQYTVGGAQAAGNYFLACIQLFALGKEGSIPVGLFILHMPAQLVATAIILTDLAFVLLTYPLFHLAFEALSTKRGILGAILRQAKANAVKHRTTVERYGFAALGLFMILPGPMSSPPMGIILGRLVGLRPLPVLLLICAAIATTTAVWTAIYLFVLGEAAELDNRIPLVFTLTLTAFILGHTVWSGIRSHRREKAAEAARTPPR